ncbi:MAG: dTDP-4-dehydrorhamnose reductase, partial [Panacagrimonas sp.]
MRVLLTGSSGQVGTEFRRRAAHLDVLAPTREEFDLARPETLERWLQAQWPQLIVNAGAFTAVDRAEDEEALALRINGDAVQALASFANAADIPLLQLSTDYVFDGTRSSPYTESDSPNPASAYGRSKAAGESAARSARQHAILRLSWVFASHGSNFVRTMLRLARQQQHLRVVDDQFGGPTWAGHVADALHAWIDAFAAGRTPPSGTWHFSGTPHTSWHAFACELLAQAHRRGLIDTLPRVEAIASSEYPTRARRPANSRLDSTITRRTLGLQPADWREGLA